MEKRVFRKFMDNEVAQKTAIFADAFSLNIDSWRPANSDEHPYRIIFYNSGMVVGYIDAIVEDIGSSKYVDTDMPFVLFTPFGKITGYFTTHETLFKYSIDNRKDSFKKIDGLFEVRIYDETEKKYYIASTLTLNDLENNHINVVFNSIASNYTIEISKESRKANETVRMYFGGDYLSIEHFSYSKYNQRQIFAKIKIDLDAETNIVPVSFEFLNDNSNQKVIEMEDELFYLKSYWEKLGLIDFDNIEEDIATNSPRMFSFIDEVRDDLTLLANGLTPVSIYDKIARLCFHEKSDQFKLAFTRAKEARTALTHNLILKKMNNHEQKKAGN